MSEENVARLRALYDDWAQGNLKPGGEIYAVDVTFQPLIEGRQTLDREGFERFMREFLDQWEGFAMEAEELVDLGDTILVTERQRATGKSSGIEIDQIFYVVWRFRDGLVSAVRWETDLTAAREATGLFR
jgi:ketosteroid isomerase-like protein